MITAFENQFESWRMRLHGSAAGQFFRWWIGELKQMLPAGLRARLLHRERRVVVRIRGDELELGYFADGEQRQLDVFSLEQDVQVQQQQIRDLLHERDLHEVPRELLLAESDVLRKEVILPIAAETNLRQALGFEMDRQTPFQASQVYYDYRVLNRDREGGHIRVELVVCVRAVVDAQIAALTPRGMAPTGVDVAVDGTPAGLNLLPREMRYRMTNRRARINWLLGLATVVALAFVMVQSLWLREKQLERVREAIDSVRIEARQVQNIREEIEDASESAGFMMARRAESVPTVMVLAEVTRTLPDDTYLDRMRVWSGNVQMQGKSDNAQRLIELVNESSLMDNAAFRGPTRLDARSSKEIFDLTAKLNGEESG